MTSDLGRLPSVDRVLREPAARLLAARSGHDVAVAAIRGSLERIRSAGDIGPSGDAVAEAIATAVLAADAPVLRPVLNATGVIVHTNLGRAPLAAEAADAVGRIARGYANLELDLESGGRGSRQDALEPLLRGLTGAEAGIAVANNAAALVLSLATLAAGREVVVSRGQLVEIGDGFRIAEIMATSGARLVEVGSTNRTTLHDYERAIGPDTALLLRVHPSNYRVVGFTDEVSIDDLARLGAERGTAVMDDVGSGLLVSDPVFAGEPAVLDSVAAGASITCFSGDKLLGGPQAGLIVGRREHVAAIRRHPLARAVRIGKLATAALEATLRLHRDPRHARSTIPVLRMAHEPVAAVRARATRIAEAVGGTVVPTEARIGGGALPTLAIPSAACSLPDPRGELAAALRTGALAVVGRTSDGALLLDARTISDDDVDLLVGAVHACLTP